VREAVKRGTLVRPLRCAECGAAGEVRAYHLDYDLPLEVLWLCLSCHRERHPPPWSRK
jgi:hypothetical protein